MTTVHLIAKVKDTRTLELPEEAQDLNLKPGEEVSISLERNGIQTPAAFPPNGGMLAAMREIAERQKGQRYTDNSNTMRLLREARSGAAYDRDPTG